MKSITHIDANAEARRTWLLALQSAPTASTNVASNAQSDFEKSFAFRLALVITVVVIGINLFSSPPPPARPAPSNHATV
ncbi:hypothetical protein QYH69_29490 [Paraburkholderia sp. SARCC-3016]|uniref:hypothetical protein n=1 Tax=Paraburkholderia sp. SARCC-3016 TaxID=3058611 RepID=UPI0028082BF5|nr:hypothetical protein [Paraburkholderia sp. SARCC-3016]MDQ7981370.1 hypothetical protein [Paraburkholderia sp. SARCC-3016]